MGKAKNDVNLEVAVAPEEEIEATFNEEGTAIRIRTSKYYVLATPWDLDTLSAPLKELVTDEFKEQFRESEKEVT